MFTRSEGKFFGISEPGSHVDVGNALTKDRKRTVPDGRNAVRDARPCLLPSLSLSCVFKELRDNIMARNALSRYDHILTTQATVAEARASAPRHSLHNL